MGRCLAVNFLHDTVYLCQNLGIGDKFFVVCVIDAVFSSPEMQPLKIGNNDCRCELLVFTYYYAVLPEVLHISPVKV